ncbi:UV DNA damage repair endonuclease UvsE [Vulgatibacter incomptus]|uniref:UV DNA damage endonuclease n=1 Tax=Vulgatibacter incomptus TaxID=1391653 RepID=A0A0K1PEQ3_9BACT|nr:UV DNA damage repair endonuclease UvsE [Vulgatibacter incomptus]AKU91995.1 UV DNA damage endonuclease [Vulgatibacter incomptus]
MVAYRLGYVAINLTLGIGASHRCLLKNAKPERLESLIAKNLEELERILRFNEENGIEVFRIGSSLVPFASHPINRLRWWKTFARDFDRVGSIARRSGQRLSMHPSPAAASLSSARPEVRRAAVAELRYSARVLDLLGQSDDGRVVVHVGGAAPSRKVALAAARRFLDRLPDEARRRIAIENDCRIWSGREVAALATESGLPFVADLLHDRVRPSDPPLGPRDLMRLASRTWRALGLRPKHHLASQRSGSRTGAHADYIDPADFESAVEALEEPADFMLEAKKKDLALFALRSPPR